MIMLSFSPIIFVSLLLTKAGALPAYPPPGSTGAGGGECIAQDKIDPTNRVFPNGNWPIQQCNGNGVVIITVNGCPAPGKKTGQSNFCLFNDDKDNKKDKTISFKGICTPGAQATFQFNMIDLQAAVGLPQVVTQCPGDIADDITGAGKYYTDNIVPTSFNVCQEGFACQTVRRRNLLAGDDSLKGEDSFAGTEAEVLEFFEECGKYEYEGLLHVTDHLYALGIPSEEAIEANCPYIMINGLVGNREDPMSTEARKEIKLWSNKEDFAVAFPSAGSLSFGSFLGTDVFEAFHKADVTTPGFSHYDAIKNNCGTFIINLANALDVKIDGKVTTFVARRLVEKAGEDLLNQFRNSVYFPSLFDGHNRQLRGDIIDGEQLVELVVESTAAGLLN